MGKSEILESVDHFGQTERELESDVLDDSNLDVGDVDNLDNLDGDEDAQKKKEGDVMGKDTDKQQSNIMLDTYYNA